MSDATFGPFQFDRASGELTRDGKSIPIGTRGAALLRALIEAEGSPVDKDALLEAAWPGTIVEESNLSVQIAVLRKTLGERDEGGDWIATVPRVGYRLIRGRRSETSSEISLPTIAVLPFQNLSGDPDQEYFADGMVDDLIAALSRFRSFAVIGRRPSFARKGLSADPKEVAAELGVRYLLEGSVRRSGDRLRLVAKLLGGLDGATLWVETFEGSIDDVFDFQDRITRSVAAVVEPQIQRAELERGRRERPTSITAYDLYLRALAKMYVHTPAANAEAFSLMQKALDIEPDNDVFLALASWALEYRTAVGWPPLTVNDRALCVDLAHRALRAAGDNARVLSNCGNAIQSMGGEFERGQLIVNRAVMLNPNDVAVLHTGGVSHLLGGDLEEGLRLLQCAIEIQPNHAYEAMGVAAAICVALGRYAEALDWARRGIAINDKYLVNHWAAAASAAHLGFEAEASAAVAQIEASSPGFTIERLRKAFDYKNPLRPINMVEGLRLAGLPER